jgi:hypothetical protein
MMLLLSSRHGNVSIALLDGFAKGDAQTEGGFDISNNQ